MENSLALRRQALPLPVLAQQALDQSDLTMLRCVEKGVTVPAEWSAYRDALRAMARGNAAGPLPARPAYPAGT